MIHNRRSRNHTLSCWYTAVATTAPCGSRLSNALSSSATRLTAPLWQDPVKVLEEHHRCRIDAIDRGLHRRQGPNGLHSGGPRLRRDHHQQGGGGRPGTRRRLVFWSAYVLNDGETALERLPDSVELLTQMANESADNTFMIPFDMWRDVFINDGEPDLVQRAYNQLSARAFRAVGRAVEHGEVPFASTQFPRGYCRHGDATRSTPEVEWLYSGVTKTYPS